jgi:RNA polymerase sigma factor (TIGR02999 family)
MSGDESADTHEALFAEVYDRLKAMASRRRAGGPPVSLATTELVHEAYLRIRAARPDRFAAPEQFFAYAARAMRHILVDAARERAQLKSGGGQERVTLTHPAADSVSVDPALALELDAALTALAAEEPRAARVAELHWFAGLTLARVAELLGIAERTAHRDWCYARAFLAAQARG